MTSSTAGPTGEGRSRSWGETQIARLLDRNGLPYLYEHPLAVIDDGKTRVWYPDFQLRGFGLLIEYCGRPDDPDYAAGMARKKAVYRANGLTAMMITPDQFEGDWPSRLLGSIEAVLADRLERFRESRSGIHLTPQRPLSIR